MLQARLIYRERHSLITFDLSEAEFKEFEPHLEEVQTWLVHMRPNLKNLILV